MRQGALTDLLCPHCGKLSHRSLSFIAARRFFVCNHCHEMVPVEVGVAAARQTATRREPLAVRGR